MWCQSWARIGKRLSEEEDEQTKATYKWGTRWEDERTKATYKWGTRWEDERTKYKWGTRWEDERTKTTYKWGTQWEDERTKTKYKWGTRWVNEEISSNMIRSLEIGYWMGEWGGRDGWSPAYLPPLLCMYKEGYTVGIYAEQYRRSGWL